MSGNNPLRFGAFISDSLHTHLLSQASSFPGVAGLAGLQQVGLGSGLETPEALQFLVSLYHDLKHDLSAVLAQRVKDRAFIDQTTKVLVARNNAAGRKVTDGNYESVLGKRDSQGNIVMGPLTPKFFAAPETGKRVAPLPDFLQGPHVTLFGPPDSAKMSINAMNAFHRRLPNEPPIVAEILERMPRKIVPKWGADDEDSKTPLRQDIISAGVNLSGCFNGNIKFQDPKTHKMYELETDRLSHPFKRFPGLAMPCTFLFQDANPLPLHLYDFALHLFQHWHNQQALVFYVPKLESEHEARYVHRMIECAEKRIKALNPSYKLGTVRVLIVMENPRAIFRVNEIVDALFPYFAGASLGWHDYLASTARVFREDPNYRIPVKADPFIVIKHIKLSHELLPATVGKRGGICLGGMYGILPTTTSLFSDSFQVTIKGYIKDIVTQLKRGLDGFWVAHPDFVRIGLALVSAWHTDKKTFEALVRALTLPKHHGELLEFISNPDMTGFSTSDAMYPRALIAANMAESDFIRNNHPDEIRYNVFQFLQYAADWLRGNGCVALPAQIEGVPVRVMDDLATAERSRWEVWHELYHGRFALSDFVRIVDEEMEFIRHDKSDSKKIVQVKWDQHTAKWYPVARNLMVQLMTDPEPVEFATELFLPFVVDSIRNHPAPWAQVQKIDGRKFHFSHKPIQIQSKL